MNKNSRTEQIPRRCCIPLHMMHTHIHDALPHRLCAALLHPCFVARMEGGGQHNKEGNRARVTEQDPLLSNVCPNCLSQPFGSPFQKKMAQGFL